MEDIVVLKRFILIINICFRGEEMRKSLESAPSNQLNRINFCNNQTPIFEHACVLCTLPCFHSISVDLWGSPSIQFQGCHSFLHLNIHYTVVIVNDNHT